MVAKINRSFNPNDLTQQDELPGLANRIVDSLEHGGQPAKPEPSHEQICEQEQAPQAKPAKAGRKPRKELSQKAQIARQLNWKKSQLLNSYVNMRGCTPEKLRTQLEYCFKACLRTLQKVADEVGIKGDYTTFLPEEKTRAFSNAAKKAGMTPAEYKAEMEKF